MELKQGKITLGNNILWNISIIPPDDKYHIHFYKFKPVDQEPTREEIIEIIKNEAVDLLDIFDECEYYNEAVYLG